ncbi:MAG: DUF2309 domain-containing protein [Nitrospiraceae bacterium]
MTHTPSPAQTSPVEPSATQAELMELRSYVQLAAESISQFWPMRTFIHHNPLHGLEMLPFEQAVKRGEALFGGRGYLANAHARALFVRGAIAADDLDEVLGAIAADKRVMVGARALSHREVLRLSMIHGITDEGEPNPRTAPKQAEHAAQLARLSAWLTANWTRPLRAESQPVMAWEPTELPTKETLARWCDRTFGCEVTAEINAQLIKWCSAFLDEGEATWAMPYREQTFYRAWKRLAPHDASLSLLGLADAAARIDALSDRPDEALLNHLRAMRIPKAAWETYLALHLAALPGWAGYIKWRSDDPHDPWQARYPIDLVKYLAVRLFYERELVAAVCAEQLGIDGQVDAICGYMTSAPFAYWARRHAHAGELSDTLIERLTPLFATHAERKAAGDENALAQTIHQEWVAARQPTMIGRAARHVLALARAADVPVDEVLNSAPSEIMQLVDWLEGFPASQHAPRWLEALEVARRRGLVAELSGAGAAADAASNEPTHDAASDPATRDSALVGRPLGQLVFCIDVRSEVFRRHVEALGGYDTFGLAGFFGIPMEYQSFGAEHRVAHCPVLIKPKNQIREIPRSSHGRVVERYRLVARLAHLGHELLHELKENVVTPYVMVEAMGWFFGLPLFGKTLAPLRYERIREWIVAWLRPPVATTLTIDRLTRTEAEEMVAVEQRAGIRALVRRDYAVPGAAVTPAVIEAIRTRVLSDQETTGQERIIASLGLTPEQRTALYEQIRREFAVTPREMSRRLHRMTQPGFAVQEQAYGVEAALRLMGMTHDFARLVVFCAHGSTSQNNPYESALDCGACGGNRGVPNARAFAAMANRTAVREILASRGIIIPADTHFLAGEHDTATDVVRISDMEDVPATHRKDLTRLLVDLEEAGASAALERDRALNPECAARVPREAEMRAMRRSVDWAQVRPEWGLSKNSLLIVGRREMTRGLDLGGRSFLHSYDPRQDESGKILEAIMTAPLVVAQWINMEHYFSAVDNEVYGSGSKVYHNVVGRVGVMSGVASDLRIGLPAQTVLDGSMPYHEPVRLLAVIEAPTERIQRIVMRHPLLERLFDLEWVSLLAIDPETRRMSQYEPMTGWQVLEGGARGRTHTASDERN